MSQSLYIADDNDICCYLHDSVDARNSSVYAGEHWTDNDQLGNRASLRVRSGEQGLQITKLVEEDAGLYRCRVDFKSSPTKNFRINLSVIGKSLNCELKILRAHVLIFAVL